MTFKAMKFDTQKDIEIKYSNNTEYFNNEPTLEYFLEDILEKPEISLGQLVEEAILKANKLEVAVDKFIEHSSSIAKDSVKENPKLQHGNKSIPLGLFSPIAIAYGCIGKLNGRERYGQANYAATNVLLSIYLDAIRRHLDKFAVGQEVDAADNVPHLAAILANVDIILSARAAGTLIDDRALVVGYEEEIEKLIPLVSSLKELNKDKNPRHYTLADKVC